MNALNYISVLLKSPAIKLGNIEYNKRLIIEEIQRNGKNTNLFVFPELCLTGATIGDYIWMDDTLNQVNKAISEIIAASCKYHSSIIFGAPFACWDNSFNYNNGFTAGQCLRNCALFVSDGKLLGAIAKDEAGRTANANIFVASMPLWQSSALPTDIYKLGIIVGQPSLYNMSSLKDADIVVCIDASPYCFGRNLENDINSLSYLGKQAILYVNASANESSADNIYCGDIIVSECGKLIQNNKDIYEASAVNKATKSLIRVASDINIDKNIIIGFLNSRGFSIDDIKATTLLTEEMIDLVYENFKPEIKNIDKGISELSSKEDSIKFPLNNSKIIRAEIDLDIIKGLKKKNYHLSNNSTYTRYDFISKEFSVIDRYGKDKQSIYADPFNTQLIKNNVNLASEILEKQALALARRINCLNIKSLVIGVSGGVDSTLALLVAVKSFEILKLDTRHIYAVSMPGPATTALTNDLSAQLCEDLNVNHTIIDINDSVIQHFKDIKHKSNANDIVYENTQARLRTMILLNLANKNNSIVVGTGDMSEIALGWNTFNGDHISNYNVNCGIPKTVAIAMLHSFANSNIYTYSTKQQIKAILARPITPELLPTKNGIMQETEKIIGPYELVDFFLYYFLKYFMSKEKICYLANFVFNGTGPTTESIKICNKYKTEEISNTLNTFFKRFYKNQYKRNCAPDGPQIFDISLSVRLYRVFQTPPRNGAVFPSDM